MKSTRIKVASLKILAIAAVIAIGGCGGNSADSAPSAANPSEAKSESWREIEREVMEIHDEVMPKMGELNNLRKSLLHADSTLNLDANAHSELSKAVADLEIADSLMWAWMYEYKRPSDTVESVIVEYLESEKVRVTEVKDAILQSMQHAEGLLEEYKPADGDE